MQHTPHAVKLFRHGTGQILAQFHVSTATMSNVRMLSPRLQAFLQSQEARNLECKDDEVGNERILSIVLNPTKCPEEMGTRLVNFKSALKMIVGEMPIEVDYSGIH